MRYLEFLPRWVKADLQNLILMQAPGPCLNFCWFQIRSGGQRLAGPDAGLLAAFACVFRMVEKPFSTVNKNINTNIWMVSNQITFFLVFLLVCQISDLFRHFRFAWPPLWFFFAETGLDDQTAPRHGRTGRGGGVQTAGRGGESVRFWSIFRSEKIPTFLFP